MKSIQAFAFRSPKIIGLGDDVLKALFNSLDEEGFELQEGDILVISSKVTSLEERAAVNLEEVHPTEEAIRYAEQTGIEPEVVEVILGETIKVYGASNRSLLVLTRYGLLSNAGVDTTNVPRGYAITLPLDADKSAMRYREGVEQRYGVRIPVIIVDTKTIPLRNGTMGSAIGMVGIEPVMDFRGMSDLYGRKLQVSRRAIGDNVATIANMVMGETDEQMPFAIVRGIEYTPTANGPESDLSMPPEKCLYFGTILSHGTSDKSS